MAVEEEDEEEEESLPLVRLEDVLVDVMLLCVEAEEEEEGEDEGGREVSRAEAVLGAAMGGDKGVEEVEEGVVCMMGGLLTRPVGEGRRGRE